MKIEKYVASEYVLLDSNVELGGGTDVTEAIQEILDKAGDERGVHLIMDGAALVSNLRLHSNTTIECLNSSCGFFQKEQSSCPIITNDDWDVNECKTENVIIVGGTYNQNCLHQERGGVVNGKKYPAFAMYFVGIKNLVVRDVTIRNFKSFAFTLRNFYRVIIENTFLELPDHIQDGNQDGFHFWGPGQFLTIKNVGGRVGDDFMNIGSDEVDGISSITDVLVDGVFLDEADQGIRLQSKDKGKLDRVTIRNVIGTYKSFGFYINPWFETSNGGNFGEIFFDNIDLRQLKPNYTYRPPMLFAIGGNFECLTFKNIRHHAPIDNRAIFEVGVPYGKTNPQNIDEFPIEYDMCIDTLIIDGLTISNDNVSDAKYIEICGKVKNMIVKNITELRNDDNSSGELIWFSEKGNVDNMLFSDVFTNGFERLISDESKIKRLHKVNIYETNKEF